jgi:hypothetical protein
LRHPALEFRMASPGGFDPPLGGLKTQIDESANERVTPTLCERSAGAWRFLGGIGCSRLRSNAVCATAKAKIQR